MRLLTLFYSLLFIAVLIAAGAWYMVRLPAPEKNSSVASLRLVKTPELNLTTTILTEENGRRQLFTCQHHTCRPQLIPSSSAGDAVFDGQAWYRYADTEKRTLQRVTGQNQQTIVEETQFVRPRDLFISPTGKQVAYWLDNIREPQKKLTELWVYDSSHGSTHLVAEQIRQESVVSPVRWNRAGTHLWFMYEADNTKQLRLFSTSPAAEVTPAKVEQPEKLLDVDITGKKLAIADAAYAEWLPDKQLLTITQQTGLPAGQAGKFTLERQNGDSKEALATFPGILHSAHTDPLGEAVVVVSGLPKDRPQMQTVYLKTGQTTDQFKLPIDTANAKVVLVEGETTVTSAETAPTKPLEDAELVAFVDKYLSRIVSASEPKGTRLVTTDQANTVFIEYRANDVSQRVLVTIRDALHPEWSLRARYTSQQGQWVKTEGSRLPDPNPTRIYEWEESVKQWIKKN